MRIFSMIAAAGFSLSLLSAPALAQQAQRGAAAKPQCETYCNNMCQRRVDRGITEPRNLAGCKFVCTNQQRGKACT